MPPTKKPARKKSSARKKKVAKKSITTRSTRSSKTRRSRAKSPQNEDPKIDRLKTLIKLLEKSQLHELSYEDSDIRVRLRQGGAPFISADRGSVGPSAASMSSVDADTTVDTSANENADDLHLISSPFVGTFYTSPAPDAEAYTGVGQTVSKGQTVCIIEAMKLMNEIEVEVSGVVVEVLAENAQGVQYGDPLFKIKVR